MKTIYATHVPARRPRPGVFYCQRCGREGVYNSKRPRPTFCADCRGLWVGVA